MQVPLNYHDWKPKPGDIIKQIDDPKHIACVVKVTSRRRRAPTGGFNVRVTDRTGTYDTITNSWVPIDYDLSTINMKLYRISYEGRLTGIKGHTVVFGRSKADAKKSFNYENRHVRITKIEGGTVSVKHPSDHHTK